MSPADPHPHGRLPEILPVFPLPGVVLLPGGQLPLNIFEPRYLNLVEDALGQGRLMGMIQPREEAPNPVPDDAPLEAVGCLGRISSFMETGSGFLITLEGLNRFRVRNEEPSVGGYRRVRAGFDEYRNDLAEDGERLDNRPRLLQAMTRYFETQDIDADTKALEKTSDSHLVTSLSMVCPFSRADKQALLECPGLRQRGALLTDLMEMAGLGADDASGGMRH